jgi:small ligand-binding sensory domain FIST
MLRAGVGVSSASEPRAAAEEAVAGALATAGRADAALLFATPGYEGGLKALLEAAIGGLGTRAVVGATAHGVIGAGLEYEGGKALTVLAIAGLEAHPFLVSELARDAAAVGEEIAARLGGSPRPEDLIVLLPDPRALRPDVLLQGVRAALGCARVVGAGAADPLSQQPLQWSGLEIESGALAGIALRAASPPRLGVTQACRPASELLTVTRSEGNWILELDGRPALDVYREVARGPLAEDLRRAASFLLVALPRDAAAPLEPGGYLVRNVAGFATERRAFALPERPATGDRIALVQREPEAAREDLKHMLEPLGGRMPALGLYFDCCARGANFFGVPGLEAAYLQQAFGAAPLAGMFGSCEIGPIAGSVELLTYTGVLALIDA